MIINKHREVSMETDTQRELRLDDEKKDDNGDDAENGDNGKEEGGDDKDDTAESD